MYAVVFNNSTGKYHVVPEGTEFHPESSPNVIYAKCPTVDTALLLAAKHARGIRSPRFLIDVSVEKPTPSANPAIKTGS